MARLLVLALLIAQPPARADNRQLAKEAFREGTRLYEVAEFQKALEAFKRAYLNFEEPTLLFNIAQCHRQLGNKQEAVRFYKTYLSKMPNAPNRVDVVKMMDTLEQAMALERATKNNPPTSTIGPEHAQAEPAPPAPAPAAAPAPLVTVKAAPAKATTTPAYKKWWLWTAVGVAAAGVALGVGLGVGLNQGPESFPTVHVP